MADKDFVPCPNCLTAIERSSLAVHLTKKCRGELKGLGRRFPCIMRDCPKSYASKKDLEKHWRDFHAPNLPDAIKIMNREPRKKDGICCFCKKEFCNLPAHIRTHFKNSAKKRKMVIFCSLLVFTKYFEDYFIFISL